MARHRITDPHVRRFAFALALLVAGCGGGPGAPGPFAGGTSSGATSAPAPGGSGPSPVATAQPGVSPAPSATKSPSPASTPPAGSATASPAPGGSATALPASADVLEPGLSGEVPLADQVNGTAQLGYHRGVTVVGTNTILSRGGNLQMTWVGECAYVTTTSATQLYGANDNPYTVPSDNVKNGMAVIDVSNASQPQLVNILQSPAMLDPHESLHGNDVRKIVVGTASAGNTLDVYDATDCRHPILKSSTTIGLGLNVAEMTQGITFKGHALCLSPDGTMAYAMGTPYNNAAIDLTDLTHPVVKQLYVQAAHDCDVSPDGNRLYEAVFGGAVYGSEGLLLSPTGQILDTTDDDLPPYGTSDYNGLLVLDASQFQAHAANPAFSVVGQLQWTPESENETPSAGSHTARYFLSNGHPYLYSSDEWPINNACPWAHGRILDMANEAAPVKIADVTLDVQLMANCATTSLDDVNYSAHYVGFDDPSNAKLMFTSEYGGGMRAYDISDPYAPVEIAYYHPPPIAGEPLSAGTMISQGMGLGWDPVAPYIHYDRTNGNIWLDGYTSGFTVLHLSSTAGPLSKHRARPVWHYPN